MQKCSSHLDIEFSSLLRESLFEQSCENDVYDVSKVLKAISGVEDAGDRNVHKVVKMYINLIEQSGNSECLYSMATDSFIRNPDPAIKRKKGSLGPVGLETYATPSELQSLVLMVGTQGARILESALLALISTHVNKIKGILSMNEGSLNQLSSDVTNEAALNSVKNCSELIKVRNYEERSYELAIRQLLSQ